MPDRVRRQQTAGKVTERDADHQRDGRHDGDNVVLRHRLLRFVGAPLGNGRAWLEVALVDVRHAIGVLDNHIRTRERVVHVATVIVHS